MAATSAAPPTTTTTTTSTNTKPKRRRFREITISSSAVSETFLPVSSPNPVSPTLSPQQPQTMAAYPSSPSPTHSLYESNPATYPSSFSKFNSALTAGLLNPMSPPPQARSSPTLFEMMANEPDPHPPRSTNPQNGQNGQNGNVSSPSQNGQNGLQNGTVSLYMDKQGLMQQRVWAILGNKSPGNKFNEPSESDVRLTLSSKDGFSVDLCVHRQILVGHSRFFAGKMNKQFRGNNGNTNINNGSSVVVEIVDCDDVEVYVETLRLMYCKDLRRKLMREDVTKVLAILKVSAAIGFDAGVLSCLEYLEAAPWAEDEEEKVASLLAELRLEGIGASEVLKRVSLDAATVTDDNGHENEEVLLKLLHVVLEGKDEKARRDMKGLVSKMLRENANHNDLRKESLYSACDECLRQLRHRFLQAAASDLKDVSQIARQADNLHWILDILIDRQIAEDFLKTWASQTEMSKAHSKVPAVHRFEISRVTARLFVGIGKGQLLASKDMRCLLLQTWLVPFYDDFGWMRRASKGLDRHLIEDGLSNTILTLPLTWQQDILLAWFDRFLNSGEDCPNLQRSFEVWWRRAFWRRNGDQPDHPRVRIANVISENS